MDDICASYYVTSKKYKVVYANPTVYQKRNYHNYMNDLFQFCNQFFGSKCSVEEWLDLIDRKGWINCNPNRVDIRKQYKNYLKTEK